MSVKPVETKKGKTINLLVKGMKENFLYLLGIICLVIAWHIQTNQLGKTEAKLVEASRKYIAYKSLLSELRVQNLQTEMFLLYRADSIKSLKNRLISSYVNETILYLTILKEGEGILEGGKYQLPDSLKLNLESSYKNLMESYQKLKTDNADFMQFYQEYIEIKKLFEFMHPVHQEFYVDNYKEEIKEKDIQDHYYIIMYVIGIGLIWINKLLKSIKNGGKT
jgi:hypothetical protein